MSAPAVAAAAVASVAATTAVTVTKWPAQPKKVLLNPGNPNDEFQMYGVAAMPKKREGWTRIWVDGCFDMLHFGHTNALRQAFALGPAGKTELWCGCHSDEEIIKVKGPPIMHEEERYEALRACKWVDFVVENYPYSTRLKDMVLFEIDFVAHGDDISVGADGRNSYQEIIDAGKFRVFKRTDGISTTDLVGRMLLCTKQHMVDEPSPDLTQHSSSGGNVTAAPAAATAANAAPPAEVVSNKTKLSYLTTSRKIAQFSNFTQPREGQTVVYVVGSFDLFHYGHMRVLKMAKEMVPDAYLIAGINDDAEVNRHKGDTNYPIMNLNERVLGVLSCRYVDEVIIGTVPYDVTDEVIDKLGVHIVVTGVTTDRAESRPAATVKDAAAAPVAVPPGYEAPLRRGILRLVDSGCSLTTSSLIDRVVGQLGAFVERQKKKSVKDKASMENRPKEYEGVKEV
jgi:ethanolamine-phosphate cytidylyltransferase